MMKYEFHRDFYDLMLDSLDRNSVTFLLGTRKCGKTVCLKQLHDSIENSEYVDFKMISDFYHQIDVFCNILASIKKNEDKVYLLDEITYVNDAEAKICEIANALATVNNSKTKIVFTGSQSVALNTWADRAFAGNIGKISVDFLTYSEFLRYKNLTQATPDTYEQFLFEVADFYKFKSLEDYLSGCIEETIISNAKASNYIFDNECDLIKDKVDLLINICYQTMFTIHNSVKSEIGNEAIASKIENSFIGSYSNIKSQDLDTLNQAFIFLKKCGLITITPIARDLEAVPDVYRSMRLNKSDIDCKKDLFEKFNITINHPMLYVQILKDVLKEDMPSQIPHTILSSIVECHARGLLPDGFEYRTTEVENGINKEHKIDYINLSNNFAVELTISQNHGKSFQVLPEHLKCICLTWNRNSQQNGFEYRDYCSYLYNLSKDRYLSHNVTIKH